MPTLRFTRDRRGYVNTYVVHTFREHGRSRSRILYWFRTPPHLKVGRAALDEDAIRRIEESNPGLVFDWTRMLRVPEPGPVADIPPRAGRGKRGRAVRPEGRTDPDEPSAEVATRPQHPPPDSEPAPDTGLDLAGPEEAEPDASEDVASEGAAAAPHPLIALVGPEGLAKLRGRYAELLARLAERVSDPAQLEVLRAEAEALNPDTWVTTEESRQALEHFEAQYEAVRARLGPRRRRSRRGRRGTRRAADRPAQDGTAAQSEQAVPDEGGEAASDGGDGDS